MFNKLPRGFSYFIEPFILLSTIALAFLPIIENEYLIYRSRIQFNVQKPNNAHGNDCLVVNDIQPVHTHNHVDRIPVSVSSSKYLISNKIKSKRSQVNIFPERFNFSKHEHHVDTIKVNSRKADEYITNLQSTMQMAYTPFGIIMTLTLGILCDIIGRKFIIFLPVLGVLIESIIFTFVVLMNLNLNFMVLGVFFSGISGSINSLTTGVLSYVSDTTESKNHGIRFGILDGVGLIGATIGSLLTGVSIDYIDYEGSSYICCFLSALSLMYVTFILKESIKIKNECLLNENDIVQKNIMANISEFYCFIINKSTDNSMAVDRFKNSSLWTTFIILVFYEIALSSVDLPLTLYLIGSKYCFTPIQLSVFYGERYAVVGIGSLLAFFLLLKYKFLENKVIFLGFGSAFLSLIITSYAPTATFIYISPIIGIFVMLPIPLLKSYISNLFPNKMRGILFANLSASLLLFKSLGNYFFNRLYIHFNNNGKPELTFMVVSTLVLVSMALFIMFPISNEEKNREESTE